MTVLHDCPRCGREHDVVFRDLARPIQAESGVPAYTFTQWARCPHLGEPILRAKQGDPPA